MSPLLETLEDQGAEVEDVLDRLMGDEAMYLQYLNRFVTEASLDNLEREIAAKDYAAAAKSIHTLKGMALNLGLLPVVDVCMDMLLDFRAGNNESAAGQLPQVEAVFSEWKHLIQGA